MKTKTKIEIKQKISPKRKTRLENRKTEAKMTLELVTPERAKYFLSLNTENRSKSEPKANRIAQSIIDGKFILTNNAIGIDVNDVMTDGQTRCMAIVKAGIPVYSWVATGLDPQARLVVDTNRIRSHANSLQMLSLCKDFKSNGKVKKDYSKLLAQVSDYIILHQRNKFNKVTGFGNEITNDELVSFVKEREEELMTSARFVTKMTKDSSYVQDSHMLFIYQMHKFFNNKRISDFIDIVCGNQISETPETCPANKLKIVLQENAIKKFGTKFNTKELLGLVIDASNKFMKRIEMKPKAKLNGRPNDANLVNVQFCGDFNEKAIQFFNSITDNKEIIG